VIVLSPKQDKLTQPDVLSVRGIARSLSERIIVVPTETPGVNAARNAGARVANGEFVCFIDDDCEMPNENYLQEMVNLFSRWPSVQGIGGMYKSPRSASYLDLGYNLMIRLWLESKTGGHAEAAGGFSSELIPTRQLVGGNACYRRQIFASGLYFRESIRWGGDETEFHLRLIDRGCALALAPRLEVEHDSQNSIRKSIRRGLAHGMASGRLPTNLRRGHWQAMPQILKASHSERWNMRLWFAFAAFMIFHWPAFWFGRALEAGKASINQLMGDLNHGGLESWWTQFRAG
jgi:GT2 family glycosyltransferase